MGHRLLHDEGSRTVAIQRYLTMHLTPRQLAFVDAYSIDGNAARAARAAGYAEGSAKVAACRLTKDNRVAAEIAKRRTANAEKLEITKEQVLAQIVEAINMAREQQNPAAMISGCVQLAKLCGFFGLDAGNAAFGIDEGCREAIRFRELSDDQLCQIASGAANGTGLIALQSGAGPDAGFSV